jgi:hypothetical protein
VGVLVRWGGSIIAGVHYALRNMQKNPAKIHITQVKDNKKLTLHICHECSQECGIDGVSINPAFSIEQFLAGGKLVKKRARGDLILIKHVLLADCRMAHSRKAGGWDARCATTLFPRSSNPCFKKFRKISSMWARPPAREIYG